MDTENKKDSLGHDPAQIESRSAVRDSLRGTVKEILYRAGPDKASVFLVEREGSRDAIAVIGVYGGEKGDAIEAYGEAGQHPRYGRKLTASVIRKQNALSEKGLVAILCGGRMPGIGKGTAQKIAQTLGVEAAIAAIENAPEKLAELPGVGPKRAIIIHEAWKKMSQATNDDASQVLALQRKGIKAGVAKKIVSHFHGASLEIVEKKPYLLCAEVKGIGFKTADEIALSQGLPKDAPERVESGTFHVLNQATSMGDCGVPRAVLIQKARAELNVPGALVSERLDYMLQHTQLIVSFDGVVYPKRLAEAEEILAGNLLRLAAETPDWGVLDNSAIAEIIAKGEKTLGITLAAQQREAAAMALKSKVCIITGGPGTGKTRTLQLILHIFREMGVTIALAAPTGKAAKRANEATGLPASTVHRLLGMRGQEDGDTLVCTGICVCDEWSMADVLLSASLTKGLSPSTALMVVGDVDQLPSVGPGQVLLDMINSRRLPVTRLTEVFRQAAGSLIIRNAHQINHGLPLERATAQDDFFFIPVGEGLEPEEAGERVAETIVDLVVRRIPERYGLDPMGEIQVLCPMNKGACGVIEMNARIQKVLNPHPVASVMRYESSFGVGDKIIQVKNNYDFDVFNGDIGYILGISKEEKSIRVRFDQTVLTMPLEALDDMKLAYAMTIHKSQGSEAPAVILPMANQHYMMLQRKLFYTGVTRGKQLVIVVGQASAVSLAIRNNQAARRVSRLASLLREGA